MISCIFHEKKSIVVYIEWMYVENKKYELKILSPFFVTGICPYET